MKGLLDTKIEVENEEGKIAYCNINIERLRHIDYTAYNLHMNDIISYDAMFIKYSIQPSIYAVNNGG